MSKGFLHNDAYRPFVVSTLLMLIIFSIGTIGYTYLSPTNSVLDAVYMTVITLTTVGYGEIIDLTNHPAGRIFTIFLLFTGVGTFVYFFSALTGFIVEGNIERIFRRRKMQKLIAQLKDHYIVSGAEFIARHIVRELVETERDLVLIASSDEEIADIREHAGGAPFAAIVGDPTDDHNLTEAGIARARGVFACMESDKDNLILTVSARLLNPTVKIVSRCVDEDFVAKIRKSGADQVVSPPMIGGLRMASAMVRPTVVTFLDVMLRDKDQRFRVEESEVAPGSRADGMTAEALRHSIDRSVLVIAVRSDEEKDGWVFNPADDFVLRSPMTLVYVGSPDAKRELDRICGVA
ncbi:MAG: NAD-binding protein [Thermoanaerobaculia bacterium]|jgi:voltage-gated potassium channel